MVSGILLSFGTSFIDSPVPPRIDPTNIETDIDGTEYTFYEVAGFLVDSADSESNSDLEGDTPQTEPTPPSEEKPTIEQLIEQVTDAAAPVADSPATIQETSAGSEPSDGEGFGLQVGSFRDPNHAESLRASLLLQGYNAHIATARKSPDEVWYRTIVGPYSSLADAKVAAAALKKQQDITAFWMEMRE